MMNDVTLRHLLDLCRKSERTGAWQYSAFLSPAEQNDLLRSPDAAGFSFFLTCGYEGAERKILAAAAVCPDVPELQPRFAPLRINIASERLDAVVAAFAGLSRGQAEKLFSAEKVFVNGRTAADKGARLKEGDILSVRGFGKAVYDGIENEARKNRLWVRLRKYI